MSTLPADDAEFREIVEEFVARFEEKMAALRAAWMDDDDSRIADIAHWIKGAGGTAGFDPLTQPAAKLEQLARHGPRERISETIRQLERLLEQIRLPVAG